MAKGISVNKPKTTIQKNLQRLRRVKHREKKRSKPKSKAEYDPLIPEEILRKTKTNPKANVTLSGKKRRLLMKKIKRKDVAATRMEVQETPKIKKKADEKTTEKMDIE